MSLAVSLLLDPAASTAIRSVWSRMAELGISTSMLDTGYPPHVTLLVVEDEALAASLDWALPDIARDARQDLTLGMPSRFPDSDIVYVACEGEGFRDLQEQVAGLVPPDAIHEHYRSTRWTPHVTLQTAGHADAALELARQAWTPMAARTVAVELVRFPPVVTLRRLGV